MLNRIRWICRGNSEVDLLWKQKVRWIDFLETVRWIDFLETEKVGGGRKASATEKQPGETKGRETTHNITQQSNNIKQQEKEPLHKSNNKKKSESFPPTTKFTSHACVYVCSTNTHTASRKSLSTPRRTVLLSSLSSPPSGGHLLLSSPPMERYYYTQDIPRRSVTLLKYYYTLCPSPRRTHKYPFENCPISLFFL